MRLDTISTIEQFIVDALLSSPQIPLGVNVVRLAATTDEEGITSLARSIVVRYLSSTLNIQQKVPMQIERKMQFELIISAQSYLAESGHDAALEMCAAAYLTLNNVSPVRTGTEILIPFALSSEKFDGLTDSSHYVYTQNYEITVTEIFPKLELNPCVFAGNCAEVFPAETPSQVLVGDVIYGNKLYSPVLPPGVGEEYEGELQGVEISGDNLVYVHDNQQTFLANWQLYDLVSTGTFDESGEFLICNIHEKDTGDFVETYFASNYDKRQLVQVGFELSDGGTNSGSTVGKSVLAYVKTWPNATVFLDPTEENGPKTYAKFGYVLRAETGVTMTVDQEEFVRVSGSPVGNAWMLLTDLGIYDRDPDETEYSKYCQQLGAENDGPETCG